MRFRNTIVAAVLLLIIAGYLAVNFYLSKPVPPKTILQVTPAQIARIELKYPDRQIVIERKPSQPWMLTAPMAVKADQSAADNLARAIAECQTTKTVDANPTDLARFDLAQPPAVVTVTTAQGKTLPGIEVGKATPVGYSAYVKLTGQPAVMLTSSNFPSEVKKTVNDLRDRELMTFKVDDVNRFAIERDGGAAIEVDRDHDKWKIVKPAEYPADATLVGQLLTALANAKVADFVSDTPKDLAGYGLEKPHLRVTVYTGKESKPHTLSFGSKQKEPGKDAVYARLGDRAPVYTVYSWVFQDVDKSVPELRDKTVMNFDPSKLQSVKVDSKGKQFSLRRTADGKWELVEGTTSSGADPAKVERFLDRIRDLKGNSIVADPMTNPAMFGMNDPAVILTLIGKAGKQVGEVKLASVTSKLSPPPSAPSSEPSSGTDYYAASSASTALFSIDRFLFDELNKPAEEFALSARPAASPSATPANKRTR